jgi:hypothetical protein
MLANTVMQASTNARAIFPGPARPYSVADEEAADAFTDETRLAFRAEGGGTPPQTPADNTHHLSSAERRRAAGQQRQGDIVPRQLVSALPFSVNCRDAARHADAALQHVRCNVPILKIASMTPK